MIAAQSSVYEAGAAYLRAGWQPLALSPKTKVPRHSGWQQRKLTEPELEQEFRSSDNIGMQCGLPSQGLIDVDVDDPAALALAAHYLPSSDMRHGRIGNPNSHFWYQVDESDCKTVQFRDPDGNAMLIEIRGTGGRPWFHRARTLPVRF